MTPRTAAMRCGYLLAIAACVHGVARGQSSARGITFVIDTNVFTGNELPAGDDALRLWGAFASFTGHVTFAAGRGRLDVLTRRNGPVILVDSIAATAPLAVAGDYYLFDSTGFVLVHPATRTFSSFSISDDVYNYDGRRDGWPRAFQFFPSTFDTVVAGGTLDARRHGPLHIYWHTDSGRTAIARGRLTVDDAPMGEMSVAQWFAAARAMARLADSARAFSGRAITVTTAVPRAAPGANGVPVTFILKYEFRELAAATVDVSRLSLPAGFVEARWPGFERVANPPGLSADRGARWRRPPRA